MPTEPTPVIPEPTKAFLQTPFGNMLGTMIAQLGAVGVMAWILIGIVNYQMEEFRDQRKEQHEERDMVRKESRESIGKMWAEVKDEREKTRRALHELVMEAYEMRTLLSKGVTSTKTFSKTSNRLDTLKKETK